MGEHQRTTQPERQLERREEPDRQQESQHRWECPSQRQLGLVLRNQSGLLALPTSILEELAQAVGNRCLIELLRGQNGGGVPTCPVPLLTEAGETSEVNEIQTSEPRLHPYEGWPACSGGRPAPCRFRAIRSGGG